MLILAVRIALIHITLMNTHTHHINQKCVHKLNVFIINLSFSVSPNISRCISDAENAENPIHIQIAHMPCSRPVFAFIRLHFICAVETRIVTSSHSLSAHRISYAIYELYINKICANIIAYCFGSGQRQGV